MRIDDLFDDAQMFQFPVRGETGQEYAIYVDNAPVVKFSDKRAALSTFNELRNKFPFSRIEIRPMKDLSESNVTRNTAQQIARELHDEIQDMIEIRASGVTTGLGAPERLDQKRNKIRSLYNELEQLGYEFDARSPGFMRPLTIDIDPQQKLREYRCVECGGSAFADLVLAEKKDACYYKVKSRYKVWPSAYASGALVQCRKKGAKNWGSKNEATEPAPQREPVRPTKAPQPVKRKPVTPFGPGQQGMSETAPPQREPVRPTKAPQPVKKKPVTPFGPGQQGVAEGSLAEMDKSAPQPGRDGRVSHSTYGSRDKGGSKGPEKEAKPITAKKAKQDALDILKKQDVAGSK